MPQRKSIKVTQKSSSKTQLLCEYCSHVSLLQQSTPLALSPDYSEQSQVPAAFRSTNEELEKKLRNKARASLQTAVVFSYQGKTQGGKTAFYSPAVDFRYRVKHIGVFYSTEHRGK